MKNFFTSIGIQLGSLVIFSLIAAITSQREGSYIDIALMLFMSWGFMGAPVLILSSFLHAKLIGEIENER